jgi:hypothetical protein
MTIAINHDVGLGGTPVVIHSICYYGFVRIFFVAVALSIPPAKSPTGTEMLMPDD